MRNVNLGGTKMKIETVQEEIQELSILELPKKKKDLLKMLKSAAGMNNILEAKWC